MKKYLSIILSALILVIGFRISIWADSKITALTELTAIDGSDILYVIDDPAGTPTSKKITALNLFDLIDTAAELETVANLGAYASDFLAATSEANFKSITNLEAGTDYNAYSAALNSISGLTETNGGIPYGTADNSYAWLAAGAEGTLLMGNGASAPSFLAAGTAGYFLIANGAADPVWTEPTGIGSPVKATSPTLVTPILGTPTSGTLTNCTGLPAAGIADANAGTDITADLEEETHASEHAPNGADPIDAWYWGGALTVGDATPPVTNGYLYDCTGGTTIAILDFYDSGDDDHSEFTDGDRIGVLMNDADVTLDFDGDPAATYLEGNAGTDFAGHATQIQLVIFIYRNGVWYASLSIGQSNALTLSAKVGMNTVTDADGFTMTAAQGYNYTVYATGAGTIVMPPVAQYMQFCVENLTDGDVVVNPDATGTEDTPYLNGQTLAQGDSMTGTDYGDILCCTYFAADTWSCQGSGYEDSN